MISLATTIVQTLQKNGFEAYFAGGSVRDMLMGKDPSDIDIATNALPEQIQNLFKKTFPIGVHFGVILVHFEGHNFEIATFRSDSGLSDGRRPAYVTFTTAQEDAQRRDFTINGLFYDPITQNIIDFVGGKSDIKKRVIRFIGTPHCRIEEDFLRILRAVRFKNRFGFDYAPETQKALHDHASGILEISKERILQEFHKMILHSSRSESLKDLFEFGIFRYILPEIEEMKNTQQPKDHHSEGDVFTHTLQVLSSMPENLPLELYWAAFFHDIGKAYTKEYLEGMWTYHNHESVGARVTFEICTRLAFSTLSKKKICWLVENEKLFDAFDAMKLSTKLTYFDHQYFDDLLLLHKYDVLGSSPTGEKNRESKNMRLQMIAQIEEDLNYARQKKILPSYNAEFFSGKELIEEFGISQGKKIGEIKEILREMQLEGEITTKEAAREFIEKKY